MAADPLILVDDVRSAGERLLRRTATLDDAAVAGASRLPGWSRGHVLTHLARNADGVVNLLTWARTGNETPQYPSLEHRATDIEAGAGRPAAEQLADLTRAETRMLATFEAMPANAWANEVRWADGRTGPAALIPWKRLREVELHHVDLDAGYEPSDWTEAFAVRMAAELAHRLGTRADAPRLVLRCPEVTHDLTFGEAGGPVIAGDVRTAVAWLSGRGDGAGLTGPLPAVPPFG